MDEFKTAFGRRLRIIRENNNLSLEKLSEMLGITSETLGRIELGKSFPKDTETITKAAKILNIDVGHLFSDTELSAPKPDYVPPASLLDGELQKLLKQSSIRDKRIVYKILKSMILE
jgi:transcriptional regulator with XRE-family HTH domain